VRRAPLGRSPAWPTRAGGRPWTVPDELFTLVGGALTTSSHRWLDDRGVADLLAVLGTLGATGAFLALIAALERL
jgi:hypothetical protein